MFALHKLTVDPLGKLRDVSSNVHRAALEVERCPRRVAHLKLTASAGGNSECLHVDC